MERVAYYRRAQFNQAGSTLETLIRLALAKLKSVSDTKFAYRTDITAQVTERRIAHQNVGLFFTLYDEGSAAGTVQNGGSRVGRAPAPSGEEFIRTGIHIVVDENNVAYVAMGKTNDGQITSLLRKLFETASMTGRDLQFEIQAWADFKKLTDMMKDGVKSIDLGIYAFNAELALANKDGRRDIVSKIEGGIADAFMSVFAKSMTAQQIIDAQDIRTRVHIDFDSRKSGHLTPDVMSKIARNVIEADSEFAIVTSTGQKITRDTIALRRLVNIDGDGESLQSDSAFNALSSCLAFWKAQGVTQ